MVLELDLSQEVVFSEAEADWVHLFADARGEPPRIAAVLFVDGRLLFSDLKPDDSVMQHFFDRKDSQIMGLELLAIALGLSTFAKQLRGRRVVVWSDNSGAEKALGKGTARAWDHACIVHCLWTAALRLGIELRIERVPTEENIADCPSREDYTLLHRLGAVFVQPVLDEQFKQPGAWDALELCLRQLPSGSPLG